CHQPCIYSSPTYSYILSLHDALPIWQLPPLHRTFKRDIKGKEASAAKLAAARQVLADGHRLIWTDDTETPTGGALYDELTADGRALLIRPSGRQGLRPADLDAIERFALKGVA